MNGTGIKLKKNTQTIALDPNSAHAEYAIFLVADGETGAGA